MDIHVFPIPIPPPTSLSTRSLWVSLHLISCLPPMVDPLGSKGRSQKDLTDYLGLQVVSLFLDHLKLLI